MSGSSASAGAPAASSSEPRGRPESDEVVGRERGAGVVGGAVRVVELERSQAERLGEPEADGARLVGLGGDRAPGAVELLWAARLGERLQRMQPEPAHVRVERRERSGSAHVRDPRAERDLGRDLGDRPVGDAEEDELGLVGVEARRRARASRALTAEPTRPLAPTIRMLSIISWLQFPFGIPGSRSVASRAYFPASRASRRARTAGHSSSVTLYQALSRFSPSRTSMCLRWMPSKRRAERFERAARALVQRVGLELDATASPRLERVAHLEQLRLDVRARAPGRRVEPRPADLDRAVLGAQREEPRRADDLLVDGLSRAGSRCPAAAAASACSMQRAPLGARLRLNDVEPAPGLVDRAMRARGLLVFRRERLEPHDPTLERR